MRNLAIGGASAIEYSIESEKCTIVAAATLVASSVC
jgi:hypothetical protein